MLGVIVNKFSSDLGNADNEIRKNLENLFGGLSINLASIIYVCIIDPYLFAIALIFL